MSDLNEGVQWQQVTCAGCKRSYECTPADDYYNATTLDDGVCLSCLLAEKGMDPETTPVRVIDDCGEEWDPRVLGSREAFEQASGPWPDRGAAEAGP